MNKLKKKLLTKWFFEWLGSETDVETLEMTKLAIEKRRLAVAGPTKVIGFRQYDLT
jgi:hypothetical protein